MDDIAEFPPPPAQNASRPRRRSAVALVAAGLAAGVVLAGVTTATAQSGQTPTPSPSIGPDQKPGMRHGLRGHHGKGFGFPGALHGEFTTKAPDGGYQTMAMQQGEVTAVSATSVTVKSEDGFSRTYAVNDDTLVNAGDQGIGDVKQGHQVNVLAIVSGGNARAVRVMDVTTVRELRGKWAPHRVRPTESPAAT